jgi:hypothetical protein
MRLRFWRRRIHLFATQATQRLLADATVPKVVLVGGFGGSWNFGDVLQLQGTIDWHRRRDPRIVICPLIATVNVTTLGVLRTMERTFECSQVLLFGPPAAGLDLAEVTTLQGVEGVHFYGGGTLNPFFAHARLGVLDALLSTASPGFYIISGQQVDARYGPVVAAHVRKHRPRVVGARDEESVTVLREAGVHAQYSGDDSLEALDGIRAQLDAARPSAPAPPRFALQCGLPPHVYEDAAERGVTENSVIETIDRALAALAERYGPTAPVLVNAYGGCRDARNTLTSVQKTRFLEHFPVATIVDLPSLIVMRRIGDLAETLRNVNLYLGTYYHPTLLFKVLGIPSFLFTFNRYYRQKAAGIGQAQASFEEFAAAAGIADEQQSFLQKQRDARQTWLASLAEAISDGPQQ